jgi:hypothetical protein
MQTLFDESLRPRSRAVGLIAILFTVGAHAGSTCPDVVVSPSGSTFNVAALIEDTGSPEAALDKARTALSQVNSGGGCRLFEDIAACDETLLVAKKAIAALEACSAAIPPKHQAPQKRERRPFNETEKQVDQQE